MSSTEVTDYFLEGRKILIFRAENSKNMQICANLDACFSSVGQHSSHKQGKFSSSSAVVVD